MRDNLLHSVVLQPQRRTVLRLEERLIILRRPIPIKPVRRTLLTQLTEVKTAAQNRRLTLLVVVTHRRSPLLLLRRCHLEACVLRILLCVVVRPSPRVASRTPSQPLPQ